MDISTRSLSILSRDDLLVIDYRRSTGDIRLKHIGATLFQGFTSHYPAAGLVGSLL